MQVAHNHEHLRAAGLVLRHCSAAYVKVAVS
jgi:hypothetical protein